MIKISELKEEDKGRWVVYEDGQKGRLKRWGVSFIWAVYNCEEDWENWDKYKEEAAHWEDLVWLEDYKGTAWLSKPKVVEEVVGNLVFTKYRCGCSRVAGKNKCSEHDKKGSGYD